MNWNTPLVDSIDWWCGIRTIITGSEIAVTTLFDQLVLQSHYRQQQPGVVRWGHWIVNADYELLKYRNDMNNIINITTIYLVNEMRLASEYVLPPELSSPSSLNKTISSVSVILCCLRMAAYGLFLAVLLRSIVITCKEAKVQWRATCCNEIWT